jgi:Flp pilus assembly protein TadG
MKALLAKVRTGERGVVIIWIAFFMVFMLGFVALGIDVAKVMATRTQLQNAADAAALAGASAVSPATGNIMPDTAVFRAQATALQNKAFVNEPLPVQLLAGDVSYPTPKQVKVVVRREAGAGGEMITHVAQVLGIKSLSLTATATAEASLASSVCEGIVPMTAIPPGNDPNFFQTGCGKSYDLMQGQGGSMSGNFQGLSFPGCYEGGCAGMPATGADTFGCLIDNGYSCCVDMGQSLQTEPGQMSGKLRGGLQNRWDADTDRRSNICAQDYTGNGKRMIVLPITSAPLPGRTEVQVLAFATFFLLNRPQLGPNTPVVGEFLYKTAPGQGGGTTGTVFTIRLVK